MFLEVSYHFVKSKYLQRVCRTHSTTSCPQRRSSTSSSPTIPGSPRYQGGSLCIVGAYYLCFFTYSWHILPVSLHIFAAYYPMIEKSCSTVYLLSIIDFIITYIFGIYISYIATPGRCERQPSNLNWRHCKR